MKGILTLFAVLGLDTVTKKWANENLPLNRKKEIVRNRLYFWHIKNSGIAYNRFSGKRKSILLFTGGLLAYYSGVFINVLRGKKNRKYTLPLALTLGGGYGNFLERARKGKVTDFLFVPAEGRNAPIFNLADISILLGTLWLTFVSLYEK
ncbi:MAG: signal peptidase II [Anaerotignum sp.]|nr:signal peptidase II [Anaerotignum sp.]MBR3992927.1 signal peptidase II [Anaerotignum sp.]MBR6652354.1 signal peptidase II [Anaerotignum sp.]